MNKETIRKKVTEEINKWQELQSKIGMEWNLSSKAIDFIIEVIENIKEDPSLTWQAKNFNYDGSQEFAITIIPNALNDIIQEGKLRNKRKRIITDGTITSWEIWHSLSKTINSWCFVPKEV